MIRASCHMQKGFVLVTGMIFLLIMTLLAVTVIQRATLDEKVSGNLRAQNLAFQAAEAALRYCQKDLEATAGTGGTLPLPPGTYATVGGIIIAPYPAGTVPVEAYPGSTAKSPPMPSLWSNKTNWSSANAFTLPVNTIANVAEQPKCMIEEWPFYQGSSGKIFIAYLITARGVGATSTAVVWLQATLRVGTNVN